VTIRTALGRRLNQVLGSRSRSERPSYVFESDGLATEHYSPFLDDAAFNAKYRELREEWFPTADVDVRWRMWLVTQVARHCARLEGDYAEFGVYRAGCAFMILSMGGFGDSKRFFLYDTFAGVPADDLSSAEVEAGLAGAHADTSVEYVRRRLEPWAERLVFVPGDVNVTLRDSETGPLAFVHMDLNAAEPTRTALGHAFPRLSAGAMMVFDDYGWKGLERQREVIDAFLLDKSEELIALPTGQALLIKH
jgi:O-methyltransferase